jgi:uncharacterized protein DUF1259
MRFIVAILFGGVLFASVTGASAQQIDWQKVDEAFGRKPAVVSGDVHRYGFPRSDLTVMLDGVTIKPALALGKALRAGGIEVTALHSHMLDEEPRLFFMHFWANDDAIKLAKTLRGALDKMANVKNSL